MPSKSEDWESLNAMLTGEHATGKQVSTLVHCEFPLVVPEQVAVKELMEFAEKPALHVTTRLMPVFPI